MRLAIALCLLLATAARAQEQYDREYIGFDDVWATNRAGTQRWVEPYLGKYKVPLSTPDFYRLVGRDDLAAEYQSRSTRSSALLLAGGAVVIGAVIAGAVVASQSQSAACDVSSPGFAACAGASDAQARSSLAKAGAIGLGGGLLGGGLMIAGLLARPQPVSAPEMREMADRYNQQLQSKLGVLARPDGGGVALSVQF